MDVDVVEPNPAPTAPPQDAIEPTGPPSIKIEDLTPQDHTNAEIIPDTVEQAVDEINTEPTGPTDAETPEQNPYLLRITRELNELGVDTKGVVSSPVVAPHSGIRAPLSSLGVYEVLSAVSTQQINAYKVLERISKHSSHEQALCGVRIDDLSSSTSPALWRPLASPPSLLIDPSLPNGDFEWECALTSPQVPIVETLIDADGLGHSNALIQWNQVALVGKAKKYVKKTVGAPVTNELIWSLPREEEDTLTSRVGARTTKKRLRESGAEHMDQDGSEDKGTKKKKNLKDEIDPNRELVFRFPVQIALSIAQETFAANPIPLSPAKGSRNPFPTLWQSKELISAFTI